MENFLKNRNGRIQGIETKLSRLEMCVSTSTSEQENQKQEIALLEEALRDIQKDMKMISENQKGKSFEPENSASDDTTERRARAQQVKLGLADQAKKDDGQKNGESQTHEAATADGVKIQFLCDESRTCSYCPGLEKKLSDMKREKEELQTQIIQLKRKQGEDKKTMNGKEKKKERWKRTTQT